NESNSCCDPQAPGLMRWQTHKRPAREDTSTVRLPFRRSGVAPEFPEECANIRRQCFRLFHRCEVSPAREFGPVLDLVATLDPRPRRKWRFLWKVLEPARYFDPLTLCEMKRGRPHFEVQTARRVNRFGHPIKR